MKIWLDDLRPAPEGYTHVYSIDHAIEIILEQEKHRDLSWRNYLTGHYTRKQLYWWLNDSSIEVISCDNDLGPAQAEGYKLLDWLEATCRDYPIHVHTDSPAARDRMRAIIQKNGWTEVR